MTQVLNRSLLVSHGERELRGLALDLAEDALAALSPAVGLRRYVQLDDEEMLVAGRRYDLSAFDRVVLLGAGKASGDLAIALENTLGPRLSGGVVVVPRNPAATPKRVTTMEADHPLPTSASLSAGRALIATAETLGPRDLAICTFTGGSSALASVPAPGVSIAEKRDLHRLLLASGMSIVEINTVRKHVSAIKGGRLARAIHPAAIVNLTVSDVVGDPLDCITDLTVPDRSTAADAVLVLEEYGLMDTVPATVREHLRASPEAESPDLGDMDITSEIVARGADGSDAVVASARSRGLASVRLGALLEGDAATVGGVLATLARESQVHGAPWPRGAVLVGCGGECTVRLDSHEESHFGRGGPNLEAAVSAALALRQAGGVVALFLDTDGADGGTAVAGGLVDWSTEERSRALGVSLRSSLIAHTTMSALEAVGDAVVTGLTQTNANDLVLLVVG